MLSLVTAGVHAQDAWGYQQPKMWPWNVQASHPVAGTPARPGAPTPSAPLTYRVRGVVSPAAVDAGSSTVLLVAHVPDTAEVWVSAVRTSETGSLRRFVSPPLVPGVPYTYRVRVVWKDHGEWRSQVRTITVQAGPVRCLDLMSANAEEAEDARRPRWRVCPLRIARRPKGRGSARWAVTPVSGPWACRSSSS
jgi:uncharacterized protein (TIGR03000 family)